MKCKRLAVFHLKLCHFQLDCIFKRDFIWEKWLNSFPKLLIISYRDNADVSKIILFGSTYEIHTVVSFLTQHMRLLSQHFSFVRYLSCNLDQVIIALLNSLVINPPWFALKNLFLIGTCLFKTSFKIFKKCSNSKLHTSSFYS